MPRILFSFFLLSALLLQGQEPKQRIDGWFTDGEIYDVAEESGVLYVGGDFDKICLPSNSMMQTNTFSGAPNFQFPEVNGIVHHIIDAGPAGIMIGGLFSQVGGKPRHNIAMIRPNGEVDSLFQPVVNGPVKRLCLTGGFPAEVIIAGDFDTINGQYRPAGIAKINSISGHPSSWQPSTSGSALVGKHVTDIETVGFGTGAGVVISTTGGIAKFDGFTGSSIIWSIGFSGIRDIIWTDTIVIAGTYGGVRFYNEKNGHLIADYDVRCNGCQDIPTNTTYGDIKKGVHSIALKRNQLIIGGYFNEVEGPNGFVQRSNIASYVHPYISDYQKDVWWWDPGVNGPILTIDIPYLPANTILIGGQFSNVHGAPRRNAASLLFQENPAILVQPYNPKPDGFVTSIEANWLHYSNTYIAGRFQGWCEPRKNLAAICVDTDDGVCDGSNLGAINWTPNTDTTVRALEIHGNNLIIAGDFHSVNGQSRTRLAAVDLINGALDSWNPSVDSTITGMSIENDELYLWGQFDQINNFTRSKAAVFDMNLKLLDSWAINIPDSSSIYKVLPHGNDVFIAGDFNLFNGSQRTCLVKTDENGLLDSSWSPLIEYNTAQPGKWPAVYDMEINNGLLYFGGRFNDVDNTGSVRLGAYNLNTNNLLNISNLNNDYNNIEFQGSTLFYTNSSCQNQIGDMRSVRYIDPATSFQSAWESKTFDDCSTYLNGIEIFENRLYAFGDFEYYRENQKDLVIYDLPSDDPVFELPQISDLYSDSMEVVFEISSLGIEPVLQRGVVWANHTLPDFSDSLHIENGGVGLRAIYGNVQPATGYYLRSFAITPTDTFYSRQIFFTSPNTLDPNAGNVLLQMSFMANVADYHAEAHGEVIDDNGFSVTARGFCLNTSGVPGPQDQYIPAGVGLGTFSKVLLGLQQNTNYYVRTYAVNVVDTFYSAWLSFSTFPDLNSTAPILGPTQADTLNTFSAYIKSSILDNGLQDITEHGFIYGLNPGLTFNDSVVNLGSGSQGLFSSWLFNLEDTTTYYVKAYAINIIDTGYSIESSFSTKRMATPLAQFSQSDSSLCAGDTLILIDLSEGRVENREWKFFPLMPNYVSSYTDSIVQLVLNPGVEFDIQLNVSNRGGGDSIRFYDNARANKIYSIPYVEGFDSPIFPPADWETDNADRQIGWEHQAVTYGSNGQSTGSARMLFFNYPGAGQEDHLYSPYLYIPEDSVTYLDFEVAHRAKDYSTYDSLIILVETECEGATSTTSFRKGGWEMANYFAGNSYFSPFSTSHWRDISVDLRDFAGDTIRIDFMTKNSNGNNLFIDNIHVWSEPLIDSTFEDGIHQIAGSSISNARFGSAVDISGDFALVSAPSLRGSYLEVFDTASVSEFEKMGAVAYFHKNGQGEWVEQQRLMANDRDSNDLFGYSISVDGNWAAIGAPAEDQENLGNGTLENAGAVYIFHKQLNGAWALHQKLTPNDRGVGKQFGWSVKMLGDELLIGAPWDNTDASGLNPMNASGSAYLFTKDQQNQWYQDRKLVASSRKDSAAFGFSVDMNSTWAVIGAPYESREEWFDAMTVIEVPGAGTAKFFQKDALYGSPWMEFFVVGNGSENDHTGYSVSCNEDYAIIGIPGFDVNAYGLNPKTDAGAFFLVQPQFYSATGNFECPAAEDSMQVGFSVDISDSLLVVGGGGSAPLSMVFRLAINGWEFFRYLDHPARQSDDDEFGFAVAIEERSVAVGLPGFDRMDTDEGAVVFFEMERGLAPNAQVPSVFHPGNEIIDLNNHNLRHTENQETNGHSIRLYPNPTSSLLYTNLTEEANFELYDIQGRMVLYGNIYPNEPLSLDNLSIGTYSLRLETEQHISNHIILKH